MSAIAGAQPAQQAEHRFFLGMTLLTTAVILWGFAPSFFLRGLVAGGPHSYLDPPLQPVRWLYIAHGLVFSLWVVLALAQASLVSLGRTAQHRRLGRVAFVLAPAMVLIGLAASAYATRHGFHDVPIPAASFSTVPVIDLVLYSSFVAAGLSARRQPQAHKRWMLLAMIVIAEAGWARVDALNPAGLPIWVSTELLLLVPLVAWDLMRLGRVHFATASGCAALAVLFSLRLWLGATPAWLSLVSGISG